VELLLQAEADSRKGTSIWKNPAAWLREKQLSRDFWVFFTVAFFFDFGFSIYVFLFNLYLLDFHFNERAIGLIGGAMTLGSVAGTLPAGVLARRFGLRPLLIVCLAASPLLGALRTVAMWETAQIGLAFVAGLAMCSWGVCFLPMLARTTTDENRASAFSLIFSVSIGTSTLGGVVCGYLPQWLRMAGFAMQPAEVKRLILLASCGIAAMGLFAVLRMRKPLLQNESQNEFQAGAVAQRDLQQDVVLQAEPLSELTDAGVWSSWRHWRLHPFLLRFLPSMALWTAVLAAFTPFANVYLSRDLHIPLSQIGLIFSVSQVIQFFVGLTTPLIFRRMGLVNGIAATQVATAVAMAWLAGTHDARLAVALYLGFSAMQWMSAPGLYNLLMSKVPDAERSTAASMTLFCNAVVGAGATAGAGILLEQFGYPRVLVGIAALAVLAAMLFRLLVGPMDRPAPVQA
jgi:MFS family permease